jgi:signal-transduction protein with cAMP-binding, CBS, and nucleotidyltransferase domain
MKAKSSIAGIRNFLLPRADDAGRFDPLVIPAGALFGPAPKATAERGSTDLVGFLKRTHLFEDLKHGELIRLGRIVHERSYRDGEYISEQGKPGAALFVLRNGVVEITRRKRNGEEVPLATLEPPASFDELAAVGEVVRWNSARACGPVSLVALGRSDLDALSGNFPVLANKILKKLAQITAARLQMFVESQYFGEQDQEPEREPPR